MANPQRFTESQTRLNMAPAFCGYILGDDGDDGKVQARSIAVALEDAQSRAERLLTSLESRGVHKDARQFCKAELLVDNYFHAVFEATKSAAERIRLRANSTKEGAALADHAFGGNDPLLRINDFASETEKSERRGFVNLLKGVLEYLAIQQPMLPKSHGILESKLRLIYSP
jgi:hypothetical protein